MCVHIGIEQLPDHALVLRLVPCCVGLEKLNASFAQRNGDFHAFIAKCELIGWRKEVGYDPIVPQGLIRVPGFRGHRSPFPCARILRQRFE